GVPSKMMIRAGNLLAEGRRIPGMAGRAEVHADWAPVARRIRDEATDNWDDTVAADRFTGMGGILVRGHGRITAPGEVTVTPVAGREDGAPQELRAHRGIVIATGTKPAVPPIPGLAGTPFWTNHKAIEAERVPDSLLVLGGGAIGVELAQVFARFDSRVTVAEGAASGCRPARARAGCGLWRSRRPGVCAPGCSTGKASRCVPGVPLSAAPTPPPAVSRSPWPAGRSSPVRRCWWPPAGALTSPR